MKEKSRETKKEKKSKKVKKESVIVTKESICATCALFFFIGFLILCTRSLIFGGFGADIHAMLMGIFGYASYPLFLGAVYLCVAGLFDKSFVKNKKAGWTIGIAIVCIALVVHTALTMTRFDKAGYLSYCFAAGADFPAATATGWLGGVIVFAIAKLVTQVGALVLFSLLALFFGYISFVLLKKQGNKTDKQIKTEQNAAMDIPLSNGQASLEQVNAGYSTECQTPPTNVDAEGFSQNAGQAQPQTTPNAYAPTVAQRPGVRLYETDASKNNDFDQQSANGFSPFGNAQTMNGAMGDEMANSYERSRAFLFGGTPAENYKKNLLFDPNANVNKRPPVNPNAPNTTYVPSYVNAYENSVNESTQSARPVKVVSDNTQTDAKWGNAEENSGYDYIEKPSYTSPVSPVAPMQSAPILEAQPVEQQADETPVMDETPTYSAFENRSVDRGSSVFETPTLAREEQSDTLAEETAYRRHDYMDLFSTSNPNVFGRDEEIKDDFSNRNAFAEMENSFEERGRNGLNLFDEDNEPPVSRGFDFDTDSDRTSADGRYTSSRFSDAELRSGDRENSEPDLFTDRGRDADFSATFDRTANANPILSESTLPLSSEKTTETPAPTPKKPRVIRPYVKIPLDDLDCRDNEPTSNFIEVEETKQNIISTLEEFKVTGASIASVTHGPTVTRYNVTIPRNISPKKVVSLDESIAISLRSNGVNVYPNYEDGVVSIEVPNKERQFVQLGCMLSGNTFVNAKPTSLMFAMGKDVANKKIYGDITKMIHLLVAGSSGSGKSVFLGALIISLIYKYSPEELRLILIDPKKTEFVLYNDLPHLMINEIITDVGKAVQSLNWAIGEMNRRYSLFEQMSRAGKYVVNLDQYNENIEKKDRLPKIVIIIDELADLMLAAKKEMEDRIQNLTQKARAAGIHLIVATQRPSTDVITGVIKSNLPTRVAFYVASDVDSRVILDQTGAQKLLGKGDFLYTMPGLAAPSRVQSAFISPEESQKVVNFIKNNNEAYYDEEATAFINSRGGASSGGASGIGGGEKELDPMNIEALRYVILSGSASISMIQRKCSAGYNRAGKIVEWMEDMGYISAFDGAKARKVLITKEQFESLYGPL